MNLNLKLKQAIDLIFEKYSLSKLLNSYGELSITGSYVYDLMAWRDFDLVLKVGELTTKNTYSLVNEIGICVNPAELRVVNNLDRLNQNRPCGFWIGIYLEQWKIDLWVMDEINANKEIEKTNSWTNILQNEDKEKLIELKYELSKNPEYHKKFSSIDLYNAFVKGKVRTVEQFHNWLIISRNQ